MKGLSSSLVSMGYLSMLITLPNCSSIGIRNKALPLQNFREGRNLHWIMCSNYDLWSMGWDGNVEDIASTSSTNYLGIFLAIKIVAPLETGRNAILA